jgi:hypothetical protein
MREHPLPQGGSGGVNRLYDRARTAMPARVRKRASMLRPYPSRRSTGPDYR